MGKRIPGLKIGLAVTIGIGGILQAKFVDLQNAQEAAVRWAQLHAENNVTVDIQKSVELSEKAAEFLSRIPEKPTYYIVKLKPKGWVIVSADDTVKPIIGFNLDTDNVGRFPVQMKDWLNGINNAIESVRNSGSAKRIPLWNLLQNKSLYSDGTKTESTITSTVGPLLGEIEWNQGTYYNAKCPADSDGPDGHVWAGCVATAMTQIMKYYNYPSKGEGSHSYDAGEYGTLSADFGNTVYHWDNMPNSLSTYNDDVATLLYHAGVAVNMQYGPNGSWAYFIDASLALKNYFRYAHAEFVQKKDMSDAEWNNLLKNEFDHKRPVFYGGTNSDGHGGHAFVCDGYRYEQDGDEEEKYYHFNWGWSGYYNGWYEIGELNPGGGNFNYYNCVVYNIMPKPTGPKPKRPTNFRVVGKGTGFVKLAWRDNSKNERGFAVYYKGNIVKRTKRNRKTTAIGGLVPGAKYTFRISAFNQYGYRMGPGVAVRTKGKKTALTPLIVTKKGMEIQGALSENIPAVDKQGSYARYYLFRITKEQNITIKMNSDFDTYLFLKRGKGRKAPVIESNDDSDDSANSKITRVLTKGIYTIEATTYTEGVTGVFTLGIQAK